MKQRLRRNIFETNSSSIHTLTVFNNAESIDYNKMLEDFDKVKYNIEVGEFGWDFETYNDPISILEYLYSFAYQTDLENNLDEGYVYKLKQLLPSTNFIKPEEDRYYYGIDHCYDWENNLDFIFEDKENLAEVMFNGEIKTGNDNTDSDYIEEKLYYPKDKVKIHLYKSN